MSGTGPKPKVLKKGVTFKQGAPNIKSFQVENAPAVLRQGTRRKAKPKACGPRGQRPVEENTASQESVSSSERNEESESNETNSVLTNDLEEENNGSSVASENLESVFSNTNSESSSASDTSELSLLSGPIIPIAGNPNLPSILFIGEGNVAEQLHLGSGSIQTMGSFNTHTLGDYKELQRLYGVKDDKDVEALQLAFGVPSLTKRSPPLKLGIEANCIQPYFPLVIKLLSNRIRSLQTSLNAMSNGLQKRGKVAFAKWLEDTIRSMKAINSHCPSAKAITTYGLHKEDTGSENSDSVGSANTAERNNGGSSCNCLQDINLLRDLVYVTALLQGSTSPEVQAQIDSIGLKEILELAEDGETERALEGMKRALEALKSLPDKVETGSAEQEFINELYSKLTGTKTTVDARKEDVLKKIDELINLYIELTRDHEADVKALEAEKSDLEALLLEKQQGLLDEQSERATEYSELFATHTQTLATKETEQLAKQSEVLALTEQLRLALSGKSASNTTVKELEAQIATLQSQLTNLTTKGAKAQANLRNAHVREIEELQSEHSGRITALEEAIRVFLADAEARGGTHATEVGELEKQLKDLRGLLSRLKAKEAEIGVLRGLITGLQAEPEALRARLAEVTRELDTLKASQKSLSNTADDARRLLADKTAELATITANRNVQKEQANKLPAVQGELTSTTRKLEEATAKLTVLAETHRAREKAFTEESREKHAEIAAARIRLGELEGEAETSREKLAECESLQAKITALEAELAALKAGGATATAGFEEAKRALQLKKEALETAKNGELADLKEQKNGQIARLQGELTAKNTAIDELTAKVTSKNAELLGIQAKANANVKDAQNTATATVAEAERKAKAEVEALTKQLADEKATKANLEEQLRVAPSKESFNRQTATLEEQRALIERLSAELEARPKTDQLTALEGQLTEMRASLEGKQVLTPEQISELQQQYVATYKTGADEYITGMLERHKAELSQRNARIVELEKKPSAEQLAELEGVLAEAKRESSDKIGELESKIAQLESAKPPDTEERLNTLLGVLILDDTLRESAKTFMTTGDQSDLKTASKEMCEFFIYLKNVITLQMMEVNSTLAGYPTLKEDILQIFKGPPRFNTEENKALLSEITSMFQEIFVKSGETTYPPAFELKGSYPTISKLLTYDISDDRPLMYYTKQDQTKLTSLITTLKSLQIMNQHGIEPREDSKLYLQQASKLPTEPFIVFSQQNKTHFTPIVILAIKMLQLLKVNLNERTLKLKDICGL